MKISMMSMAMSEKGFSPAEIVQTAVDCRMDGIDWIGEHGCAAEYLKKLCDDAGLPVVAYTPLIGNPPWSMEEFMDRFKRALDFALVLEAPVMMIPVCKLDQGSRELDRAKWIDAFGRITPLAVKSGITLTFEAMGMALAPIQSARECQEVLDAVPDMRITFDTGNVETVEDPAVSYCKLADKVVHAHFKDFFCADFPSGKGPWYKGFNRKYYKQVVFGEGHSDLKTMWQVMKSHGYQGYVNFETGSDTIPMPDVLKMLCDRMRDW